MRCASGSLNEPDGLAFDASGNLWVANFSNFTVVEFTPSQLAASGSPTPGVIISASFGTLDAPAGLAFDASGNLWVANFGDSSVVEFTPSQLAASGSPTPAVTLTISSAVSGSTSFPLGLAFDASGDLWVADLGGSADEFTVSGGGLPSVIITGSSLSAPQGLAFDPHAAGLPLKP